MIFYSDFVKRLLKRGSDIQQTITPEKLNLTHLALGVAGEAGELVDAIKKYTIYNKELDVVNVIEELGDLEFFLEGVRQAIGVTREEVIQKNADKLSIRYSSGSYSDAQAQARKDKE